MTLEQEEHRKKHWRPGILSDEVRIDFAESESVVDFETDFERDIRALLSRSDADAREIETLKKIKQTLREGDEVALPESGVYYAAFESRIMAALDQAIESGDVPGRGAELTPKTFFAASPRLTVPIRGWLARTGHFFTVGGLALFVLGHWLYSGAGAKHGQYRARPIVSTWTAEVGAVREAAPQVLADTVIGFESPDDIALDLAARAAARKIVAQHDVSESGNED